MSFPTQEAFVHTGTWDSTTRKHPAMKWMETYTNDIIDGRKFHETASSVGWTSEFTPKKSTGEVVEGADKGMSPTSE